MRAEFSKLVLALVLLTYFVGVVIGGIIVFRDTLQLQWLLAFIGTPTATAIAFYAWKAKAENVLKIGKDKKEGNGNGADRLDANF